MNAKRCEVCGRHIPTSSSATRHASLEECVRAMGGALRHVEKELGRVIRWVSPR